MKNYASGINSINITKSEEIKVNGIDERKNLCIKINLMLRNSKK